MVSLIETKTLPKFYLNDMLQQVLK